MGIVCSLRHMRFVASSASDSRCGLHCLDYTVHYIAFVVTITLGLKWLILFTLPVGIPGSSHFWCWSNVVLRICYSLNSLWKDMTLLLWKTPLKFPFARKQITLLRKMISTAKVTECTKCRTCAVLNNT